MNGLSEYFSRRAPQAIGRMGPECDMRNEDQIYA